MNEINRKLNAYKTNQKGAVKASFPTLEELYKEDKKKRKNSARFGTASPQEEKSPPPKLHTEVNRVTDNRPVKLKVAPPSRMLQEENGLIKFQQKGNGYRKAAKFLLLLSKEDAARVLQQFDQDEVEKIAAELSTIQNVGKNEAQQLLEDFRFLKSRRELPQGGIDAARNMLVNAFGEKKGRELLKTAVPHDPKKKPFEFLDELEGQQLTHLLKEESELVIATIIPFLDKKKSSELISGLPPMQKVSVTRRVARMQKLDPEAMNAVENSLREKIRKQGRVSTESRDGSAALANILKYMDLNMEQEILDELDDHSTDLSRQVKEKIFTIDMIINVEDVDLQKILTDYSDRELALLLKGKSDEVEHKVLSNISANRSGLIKQEKLYLGAVKRKDVDEATKEFLAKLRKMQLSGEILVRMPGETWL